MKNTPALLLFALAALLASTRPADACTIATGTAVPFASFPADGDTDVPVNATPFVRGVDGAGGVPLTGIALVGPDDQLVPTTVGTTVVTDMGGPVDLLQLLPQTELLPRTRYRLTHAGGEIAAFTTGDGEDGDAPTLEDTEVVSTSAPDDGEESFFGLWAVSSCGAFPGSATLRVRPSEAVISFVTLDADPALGSEMVAASREDELWVSLDGDRAVHVLAVDAAGNLSEAQEVEIDLPAPSGCAQTGGGAAPIAAALALLAARRRRRR